MRLSMVWPIQRLPRSLADLMWKYSSLGLKTKLLRWMIHSHMLLLLLHHMGYSNRSKP
jgi:hypothetical protein